MECSVTKDLNYDDIVMLMNYDEDEPVMQQVSDAEITQSVINPKPKESDE